MLLVPVPKLDLRPRRGAFAAGASIDE